MFRLLKGFGVTFNYFRKKKITIQYPEEKVVMPARFRGIHRFFPDKCIVCNLCVQICPTDVITLTGKKSEENPKKKIIDTYNIDFQGCILCDFCTEVCPTDAIVMTARYNNLSSFNRAEQFKDIHFNPVEIKIVKKPEMYRWSSMVYYLPEYQSMLPPYINTSLVLDQFGGSEYQKKVKYIEWCNY